MEMTTVLSLVLTLAWFTLALSPIFAGDSSTVDGLFLSLVGTVVGAVFFFNFLREVRHIWPVLAKQVGSSWSGWTNFSDTTVFAPARARR
jgi:glycopeptide antibiotics resistance protein